MELTAEEVIKVKKAMNSVWRAIGGDVIEEGNNGCDIPRDQVIELVLDANYIDCYGHLDKDLLKKFKDLPYKSRERIAGETFTYKTYGM